MPCWCRSRRPKESVITWGPFKRYGATVGEAGKGWCSVKAANGKIAITVQPNPEQTARSCVVNCFVTNVTNPTDEDKVLMPVEVYQEGSTGEVAANNFTYLWGTWYCTNGSTWSEKNRRDLRQERHWQAEHTQIHGFCAGRRQVARLRVFSLDQSRVTCPVDCKGKRK